MLKCCLVGVSGFANVHYEDLLREREAGRAEIIGAAIINQDEEAEKCARLRDLGCTIYDSFDAMLDGCGAKADICFIPTGIHLHAPMTIAALKAGMHVYVEKPVAATIQDVQAMKDAARAAGRFVAVGYQTMYQDDTRLMKQAILDGRLGKIECIKCRGLWPRNDAYYSRNNWAGHLKVGEHWVLDSPFNNALAHQLNMICFLAGETFATSARPAEVQAELYRGNDIQSPDTAAIRIRTQNDILLYFLVSHCPEKELHPRIVVRGDAGRITWDIYGGLTIESGETKETLPVACRREKIFDALLARAANPDAFVCDLDIAGTQTLVIDAAYQSSPVRYVGDAYIRREPHNNSTRTVIVGLDDIVQRAFEEEALYSEIGAPWGIAAPVFDVREYDAFTGLAGEE